MTPGGNHPASAMRNSPASGATLLAVPVSMRSAHRDGSNSASSTSSQGAQPQPTQPSAPPENPATTAISQAISAAMTEHQSWESEFIEFQKEYTQIYSEVSEADDVFFRFASEYKKVYRAVERTKTHALDLYNQYEAIQREFLNNVEQQADGVKSQDHDQQTLKTLKQQIKRAEQMLEQSNRREDVAKSDLRQLKHDITTLTNTIKQGVGLSAVQERTINELVATKEQMTKDLESELDKIVSLRNGLAEISEGIKITENQKRELEREIFTLKERNASKKMEIDTELRNKERLDRELRELRVIVTIKSQEGQGKQEAVNRATEDIASIEGQIKQQKQMIEKLLRDQESLGTRTVKLQQDYDEQMSQTSQLMDENETAINELRLKEKELANHKAEVKKVTRIKEILLKKNKLLEEQKLQAEMERRAIRSECDALMSSVNRLHRQVEVMKKNIDDLSREKDILSNNLLKTQTETQKTSNLVILQKQQRYNIELEIAQYRKESHEHLREAKRLESELNAYVDEAVRLQAQYVAGLQELKEQELQIFEYKRQMSQAEAKLKHQQNLYETVQSERNLHSKHLIESQSDIAEARRRLKIMNYTINGLKIDINAKEAILERETSDQIKLQKDIDQITDETKTLKNQNELAQSYIRSQLTEQVKLNQFVKEAEIERSRQENALQVLISERDNLSAQLIRRNDELTAVYDKIKTHQLSMMRGEVYYKEKLSAIRLLREEIHELRSQAAQLSEATSGLDAMKRTIIRLQNETTQEQMRVKALEEELENPINVHRWRKLEGSNPQAFDMIQLLHTLQKKLIVKNKEDKEKEDSIKIQEELYLHLKAMLAKQIGPEALEQITELEKQLKDKNVELRHMDTELNMYQAQVREYEYSITQLDQTLAEFRNSFLAIYKQRVRDLQNGLVPAPPSDKPREPFSQEYRASTLGRETVRTSSAASNLPVKDLPMLPDKDLGTAEQSSYGNDDASDAPGQQDIVMHNIGDSAILEQEEEEEETQLHQ
eukprot:jgi/Hompol1/1462/HPOL_001881-RA